MGLLSKMFGKQKLIDDLDISKKKIEYLHKQIKEINEILRQKDKQLSSTIEKNRVSEKNLEEKTQILNEIELQKRLAEEEEQRRAAEEAREIEEKSNQYKLSGDQDVVTFDISVSDEDIFIKKLEKAKGNPFNDEQLDAIKHEGNHLRIVAGAGSGKTETICSKAAYLHKMKGVEGKKICMITFTRKAANEMKTRMGEILGGGLNGMVIGTFNSIFKDIVDEMLERKEFGSLKPNLIQGKYCSESNEDNSDNNYYNMLRDLINLYNLENFEGAEGNIKGKLDFWSNLGYLKEDIRDNIQKHYGGKKGIDDDPDNPLSERFYQMLCNFEDRRRQEKIYVLNDQIMNMYKVISYNGELRDRISSYIENTFDYIFIDEFQDVNNMQIEIVSRFAPPEKDIRTRLIIVGDANQAIYMFRGSDSKYIDVFDKIYSGKLDTINLLTNYRSSQDIVYKANSLIKKNYTPEQLKIKGLESIEMKPHSKTDEKAVYTCITYDKTDEARYIISEILDNLGKKEPFVCEKLLSRDLEDIKSFPYLNSQDKYPNFAKSVVLFRSTDQVTAVVRELEARRIPYIIEKEVENCIAKVNPFRIYFDEIYELYKSKQGKHDWDKFMLSVAEKTFINKEALNLPSKTEFYTKRKSGTLYDVNLLIEFIKQNPYRFQIGEDEKKRIEEYIEQVSKVIDGKKVKVREVINIIKNFKREKSSKEKWEQIAKDSMVYESFHDLIYEFEQIRTNKERKKENERKLKFYNDKKFNGLYLLTIHKSKGLAFDNVFVIGCTENVFPNHRSVPENSISIKDCQEKAEPPTTIEEERRLMYVAMTRAKKLLYVTSPQDNDAKRSRFMNEF